MIRNLLITFFTVVLITACGGSGNSDEAVTTAEESAADTSAVTVEQSDGPFEVRPRPQTKEEIPEYAKYLVEIAEPRTPEELALDEPIQEKFRGYHNIDSVVISAPNFPPGNTLETFERYMDHFRENAFTATSVTVTNGSDNSVEEVFERVRFYNDYLAENTDKYVKVETLADFDTALNSGRIGHYFNFQSMNGFGEDLANVQKFYDLGVRTALFTYNRDNAYGTGSGVNRTDGDTGITELGAEFIREMNRVGMVVDCAHSSDNTCVTAAKATEKPMLISHTNVFGINPIGRNAGDEAIKAVGETGGAACVTFIGGFLNDDYTSYPADIAAHIQYIRDLIGIDGVCAGSDFVADYEQTITWILENQLDDIELGRPEQFPVSSGYAAPSHMGMPGEIWGAVGVLQRDHGWTDEDVVKLLGGNLMRIYEANWK